MRTLKSVISASAAILALGVAGAAFAQSPQTHIMNVQLPDGSVGHIEYTGNVPPRVVFSRAPSALDIAFAPLPSVFGPSSPFAMMERISAEMDQRMAAMFRQVDAVAARAQSGQPIEVSASNLPVGSQDYSFISTMPGSGVCMRSVEITSTGNGAAPKVVSRSAGNCGPAMSGVNAANLPNAAPAAPVPTTRPDTIWTNAPAIQPTTPSRRPDVLWTSANPQSYKGLVRKVAENRR